MVKLHCVAGRVLPAASVIPVESLTVYWVFGFNVTPGLIVTTRVAALKVTAEVIWVPVAAVPTRKVAVVALILPAAMASPKVAVILAVRFTPVALTPGVLAVTAGAGPVRNVQLVAATGLPAVSSVAPRSSHGVPVVRRQVGVRIQGHHPSRRVVGHGGRDQGPVAVVPSRRFTFVPLTVVASMFSLNVAVTLVATATPVALTGGVVRRHSRRRPVRNVQFGGTIGLPATSRIAPPAVEPHRVPVIRRQVRVGLIVSTRVVALNVTIAGTAASAAAVPGRIVTVAVCPVALRC